MKQIRTFRNYISKLSKIKEIELSQGKVAIIDSEDFYIVNKYKWSYRVSNGRKYCASNTKEKGKSTTLHLARLIMNCPKGMTVDHINHDTLDNRKCNLRICTQAENSRNTRPRNGTSRYKGVHKLKHYDKWRVAITVNRVKYHIGYFATQEEAALAYNKAALKYHGKFAYLNIVEASNE